jgi:hypothetical protein
MDDAFTRIRDPETRARRYRMIAGEYADLARDASAPFLRAYFHRIAEDYLVRADGELRVAQRSAASRMAAHTVAAHTASARSLIFSRTASTLPR